MGVISFLLWGVAVVATVSLAIKTGALREEVDRLAARLRDLESAVANADTRMSRTSSVYRVPSEPVAAERHSPTPASQPAAERTPAQVDEPRPNYKPSPSLYSENWEKSFAENWLVWAGGITLALGGAFLVKYSIDHGLLRPSIRVGLGSLLGMALCVGGDFLARREIITGRPTAALEIEGASPVPQALAAAGTATIFASLYAGYQLYGLIPTGLAFPLLAGTALLTVMLSLRHGPFVACLGLVGAFLVPALVHSDHPNAAVLFAYLIVVVGASLLLLRYKSWWWLAWICLGGGSLWALVWLGTPYAKQDSTIVCCFLLAMLGLFSLFRSGGSGSITWLARPVVDPMVRYVLKAAFLVVSCTLVLVFHFDEFSLITQAATLAVPLLALFLAYRDAELDLLLAVAPLPYLAVLITWFYASQSADRGNFGLYALAGSLIFAVDGFLVQGKVSRPLPWAALSAAVPLAAYLISYWHLEAAADPYLWTAGALVLGLMDLAAAARLSRRTAEPFDAGFSDIIATYITGALGCSVLAATIALQNAWLTMALALHIPVLGWAEQRLSLPVLRNWALALAAAVLIRLAINPEVLDYPIASTPGFNWLLYGYGAPAAAFYAGSRLFKRRGTDTLVKTLEAGAIFFTTALLTFELRNALGHAHLDFTLTDLGTDSSQVLVWLALAGALFHIGKDDNRDIPTKGGAVLYYLASAQLLVWQDVVANPLMTGKSVGSFPFFDVLLLAYGLPALFYGAIAWMRLGPSFVHLTARAIALWQGLLWSSLEMRHLFHGDRLTLGATAESEWYAYSALWLVLAGACLAAGLTVRSAWLRKTGLIGIAAVVGKVFLFDVANLGGGWRALSFLGLGGALVATGYAYRKLTPQDIQK